MAIQTSADNQVTVLSASWNNAAAAYTAFKLDVNNILTPATSKLFDVGTNTGTYTSRFSIDVSGSVDITKHFKSGITGTPDPNIYQSGLIGRRPANDSYATLAWAISSGRGFHFDHYDGGGSNYWFTVYDQTAALTRLKIDNNGHLLPGAHNTYDLGSSGTAWRTLYAVNISGSLTPTGATAGSVFFAGSSGQIQQDNANFFWDDANNRLGIGTNSPQSTLHVSGGTNLWLTGGNGGLPAAAGVGMRLMYDTSNAVGAIFAYDYSSSTAGNIALCLPGGSVGIGIAPGKKLDVSGEIRGTTKLTLTGGVTQSAISVQGTTADLGIEINNSGTSGRNFQFLSSNSSSGVPSSLRIYDATAAADRIVVTSTGLIGIGLTNPDTNVSILRSSGGQLPSSGTTPTNAALRIKANANNAAYFGIDTASPYGAWIQVADVTGLNATYPMLLNPNGGNIGIGTSNPSNLIHAKSSNPVIRLEETTDSAYFDYSTSRLQISSGGRDIYLVAGNTERARITSIGNVGIGTTIFTARLFVSGSLTSTTPTMIVKEGVVSPTGGALAFEVEKSSGATLFSVSGSGNVGIGTSIPNATFEVVGVSGSLFSVTDSLSGSLFSVNTISGLPILEVFSDNTLIAGAYNSNALVVTGSRVGIGTRNPSEKLQLIGGNLYLSGTAGPSTSVAYTNSAFSRLIFNNDFNDSARGPNKVTIYNDGSNWVAGFGIHSATMASYSGDTFAWYKSNSQTSFTIRAQIDGFGNFLPGTNNAYDLGSSGTAWKNLYATNVSGAYLTGSNLSAGQVVFAGTGGVMNGSNNLFWDSGNNRLGIGTSTSLTQALNINGNTQIQSTNSIYFFDTNYYVRASSGLELVTKSGDITRFLVGAAEVVRINSSGRVGIGTVTPGGTQPSTTTAALHILGTTSTSNFTLFAESGSLGANLNDGVSWFSSGSMAVFKHNVGLNTSYLSIKGIRHTAGSSWTEAATRIQQTTDFTNQAYIDFNPVGSSGQHGMSFGTGAGATERMRIDTNGLVGVNVTAPGARLHVRSTAQLIQIFDSTNATSSYVRFDYNTGASILGYIGTGNGLVTGGISTDFAIRSENGAILFSSSSNERARIESTGTLILRQSGTPANTSVSLNTTVQNALTLDSSGNFGVGLVPTTSTTSKIQTNADISVIYSGAQTLHLNGYYSTADNNWKYGTTGQFSGAVRFDASKGDLQFWNSSGSGTAGNTSNIGIRMYITGSGGHTLPGSDNAYDLGTTAVRWRNLYLSNTLSAPSLAATGLTQGSVVFAGSGGTLSQNNANFFWDNTNARLGIGTNVTTSTAHKVTVVGTDILVNSVTVGRGGTGAGASTSNTNAAVGVNALSNIDSTALYNAALGTEAASTGTKSYYNTAVGFQALLKNNVSSDGKNTAVGAIAMYNDSSGVGNTAVGYASLYNNSSTTGHVAVGFETLYEVANGSNNTAVGYQALKSTFGNTVANSVAVGYRALTAATVPGNVAVGMNAMLSTTNTSGSVAVGFNALADFNGGDNTAVGWAAGRGLKGVRNTAVGTHAMPNSSTSYDDATSVGAFAGFQSRGSGNTFFGSNAGYLTTTSSEVTAVGLKAAENATASRIVAVGAYALRSGNSTGNVGIGYSSLATISSNSGSTAVGYLSLTLATGVDNTGLGWQAGDSISTGAGNVAIGSDSLVSNTTATGNTAVGTRSLYSITTVSGSTAVGYEALFSTTGADNTALGWRAGRGLTTAVNSVAIGSMALSSGTGGFANTATGTTAVGAFALQTGNASSGTTAVGWAAGSVGNMTGWYNTLVGGAAGAFTSTGAGNNAFGYAALYLNTTGSDNVAIGNAALYNNTSAFYNVGIGNFSLNSNQSSRGNIAIGHRSLYTQTGGVSFNFANFGTSTWGLNVAVGMESLVSSSTGAYNTSIGNASGYKVTTGIANTFVGYGAGQNVTTGGSNVFVGADSGRDITTGNNNVVIGGHYASSPFSTQSGNIFIADGSGTLRMTITGSTGNVGIGRTNPGSAFKLDVSGSINAFNINKTYSLPDVGGSASWIKLGTFTASQGGRHLYIKVVTSNGYNANPAQQSEIHIHFKTSNGSSVDSNGFAGEATFYITNGSTAPGHNVKVKGNAAGTSATSYDVWFYQGGAYNGTSFYTVETPSDYTGISWDHAGTTGSDPGAASNTVCVGSQRFVVQSDVGIGVTTPGTKFHVDGTIRNTNMPAGILNYYIGVDGNWNIFPVVSSAKYKENITPYVTGLSKVLSLMPVTYNYKIDNSREFAGLLAEDLHNLGLKEFVLYKNDIPESIDYPNMVTLTINAIKELKSENDSLKSEIQSLKDQISSILEMLSNK